MQKTMTTNHNLLNKTSPWSLKTTPSYTHNQENTYDYSVSSNEGPKPTQDNHCLPSLLLDALGGGKRPSKSPKQKGYEYKVPQSPVVRKSSTESIYALESQLDDEAPPSTSLFTMTPGDMKGSFTSAGQMTVEQPFYTPRATTPGSLGSPMDLDARSPSLYSPIAQSPSSYTPLKSQTTITLIGFPPSKWRQILSLCKSMDNVISFKKSDDENGNWMVVTFATSTGVNKMKEYDGRMMEEQWVMAVRLGDASTSGHAPLLHVSSLALSPTQPTPEKNRISTPLSQMNRSSRSPLVSSPLKLVIPQSNLSLQSPNPNTISNANPKSNLFKSHQPIESVVPAQPVNLNLNEEWNILDENHSILNYESSVELESQVTVKPFLLGKLWDIVFGW